MSTRAKKDEHTSQKPPPLKPPQIQRLREDEIETHTDTAWWIAYTISSYILYWPALWLARAGGESAGVQIDWGDPTVWALLWLFAPAVTWFFVFGAFIYWVLNPILKLIVLIFW